MRTLIDDSSDDDDTRAEAVVHKSDGRSGGSKKRKQGVGGPVAAGDAGPKKMKASVEDTGTCICIGTCVYLRCSRVCVRVGGCL